MEYKVDHLGEDPQGNEVTAATDSAGPQVIVKGEGVHLLSRPLKDHAEAVELGKKVVKEGTEAYTEWMNLIEGGVAENLFAVFGGCFRGGYVDEERLEEDRRRIEEGNRLLSEIRKEE